MFNEPFLDEIYSSFKSFCTAMNTKLSLVKFLHRNGTASTSLLFQCEVFVCHMYGKPDLCSVDKATVDTSCSVVKGAPLNNFHNHR